MEREILFCPKWHRALWVLLLMMLCFSHAVKAEITCRSCQHGNKWRARELLLKFDKSESATGFKGEVFGHGDGADPGAASAESRRLRCAAGSAECATERGENTEPRLKRNTDNLRENGKIGESDFAKVKVSPVEMSGRRTADVAGFMSTTRHTKRVRGNSDDDKVRPSGSAQSQDPGEGMGTAGRRRVIRSDLRWSADERRAAGPRQEELKLNSSTFALTGDSSHNQAMVHWSGQNSSVSDFYVHFKHHWPYAQIHGGGICALMLAVRCAHTPNPCLLRRLR